ncbi:hypothetical protein [uncultured Rubinisphaera sp.]|uniref:hypothetical protein n=1 Tax=uncultured Rubinisphaera sp. TaxID=1678686 RepID=UPI000EE7E60B|nr:hypothetical protein [Planctomycetaceae bacterium]|tara:strand:+ start:10917 stop:12698 length:1782 start_codon:yes stop_codon:yes gene_type:complete
MYSRFALFLSLMILVTLGSAQFASAQNSSVAPMVRLVDSGKMPEDRLPTILGLICKRGDAVDLRYVFDKAISTEEFSPKTQLITLELLANTTRDRKLKPEGDLTSLGKALETAISNENVAMQKQLIQLIGLWDIKELAGDLEKSLQNPKTPRSLTGSIITALADLGGKDAKQTIVSLTTPKHSKAVRAQAIEALAGIDLSLAAESAAKFLSEATPEDNLNNVIQPFLDRKSGPEALGSALANVEIQPDVAKLAIRTMLTSGRNEAVISDPLSKAAGLDTNMEPLTKEELAQLAQEVQQHGDAERGELIFRREELNCYKCHSIGKAGGNIGPDLSAVGGSSPIDYLANSLLLPSQAIKEAYKTLLIVDIDGLQHTGIVVDEDDDRIILRDAQGKEKTIAVDDIEFEKEGDSLMPAGLTKFLTDQEFLDLVRYISALGKDPGYTMSADPTVYRWRVYQNPPSKVTGELFDDDSVRNMLFEYAPEKWQPLYAFASGNISMQEAREKTGGNVIFLMADFEVTVAGHISIDLTSTEGMTIWIDDKRVSATDLKNLHVDQGQHRLLLRLDRAAYSKPELKAVIRKGENPAAEYTIQVGN